MRKAFKKYENPKFSGLTIDFYRIFTYIYRGMPYLNGHFHISGAPAASRVALDSAILGGCILR